MEQNISAKIWLSGRISATQSNSSRMTSTAPASDSASVLTSPAPASAVLHYYQHGTGVDVRLPLCYTSLAALSGSSLGIMPCWLSRPALDFCLAAPIEPWSGQKRKKVKNPLNLQLFLCMCV